MIWIMVIIIVILLLVIIDQRGIIYNLRNQLSRDTQQEEISIIDIKKAEPQKTHLQSEFIVDDPTKWHESISGDLLKKDLNNADPDSIFYDKKVVITGEFPISRVNLATILKIKMGADIDLSIGKNTKFLLIGKDPGPAKINKAETMGITMLNVEQTMEAIKDYQ